MYKDFNPNWKKESYAYLPEYAYYTEEHWWVPKFITNTVQWINWGRHIMRAMRPAINQELAWLEDSSSSLFEVRVDLVKQCIMCF